MNNQLKFPLHIMCLSMILCSCRTIEISEPACFEVESLTFVKDEGMKRIIDDPLLFKYAPISNPEFCKNLNKGEIGINFITSGFPYETCMHMKMKKIDGSEISQGDYCANEAGELVSIDFENKGVLLRNLNHVISGHMCGEETTYTLTSFDGKIRLSCAVGNVPILTTAKDGASVSMVMVSPKADLFSIEGKGFLCNEELYVTSKSCFGEKSSIREADNEGAFIGLVAPGITDQKGSTASYTIRRMNGEVLVLNYAWGEEAKRICQLSSARVIR